MSVEHQSFYPGDRATPEQLMALADEYRKAAEFLLPTGRRGRPLSRAPFRLVAIQSIELYLDAFLRVRGFKPAELRGMQHNLVVRTQRAATAGLSLRKDTFNHLNNLSTAREYLITRYGPEMTDATSHLNRLEATLKEVAQKVTAAIAV